MFIITTCYGLSVYKLFQLFYINGNCKIQVSASSIDQMPFSVFSRCPSFPIKKTSNFIKSEWNYTFPIFVNSTPIFIFFCNCLPIMEFFNLIIFKSS